MAYNKFLNHGTKRDNFFKKIGFKLSIGDHNFYNKVEDLNIILIILCMDNLVMVDNSNFSIRAFKIKLNSIFSMIKLSKEDILIYLKAKCICIEKDIFFQPKELFKEDSWNIQYEALSTNNYANKWVE